MDLSSPLEQCQPPELLPVSRVLASIPASNATPTNSTPRQHVGTASHVQGVHGETRVADPTELHHRRRNTSVACLPTTRRQAAANRKQLCLTRKQHRFMYAAKSSGRHMQERSTETGSNGRLARTVNHRSVKAMDMLLDSCTRRQCHRSAGVTETGMWYACAAVPRNSSIDVNRNTSAAGPCASSC